MLPALLILVIVFLLLFAARVSAARRARLLRRWPALLLGAAAAFALARGAIWPAAALAALAAAAWAYWPRMRASPTSQSASPSRAELEAGMLLGVSPGATEAEIRRAYREKMARAHPDRGGRHADAARLTAARDLLLKRRP